MTRRHPRSSAKVRRAKRRRAWAKCRGNCAYCGKKITEKTMTLDHILPVSKGGTYRNDNLTGCCFKCNQEKGNKVLQKGTDNGKQGYSN